MEGASQDSEHVAEPEVDIFAEEEEEENNEDEAAGDEVDEFGEALSLSPPKTSAKMRGSMVTHDGGEDVAGYLLAAGASGELILCGSSNNFLFLFLLSILMPSGLHVLLK